MQQAKVTLDGSIVAVRGKIMAIRNWNKVADEQFKSMPKDYQDAWKDFRDGIR